jgi:hypothetical protein
MTMPDQPVHAVHERRVIVLVARAITYLVYFYLIAVEIILVLGFFLLLFGANPSAGFTEWAYRNLDRVMEPFRGIFTPIQLGTTNGNVQAIFDTSVVFAMIVYGIIALAFRALISWLSQRLRHLEAAEVDAKRREENDRRAADAPTTTLPPPGSIQPPPPDA